MANLTVSTVVDNFMQATTAAGAKTVLQFGSMADQDADSVDITNGSAVLSNLTTGNAVITGGDVDAAVLTGTAAAIDGSQLTNLTSANLVGALPAIDGTALSFSSLSTSGDLSVIGNIGVVGNYNGIAIGNGGVSNRIQIVSGTGQIIVSGGGGLAGAAINGVSLGTAAGSATGDFAPAAGSTSVVNLGTVTTGTWSATAIAGNKGGTGQTSYAIGDILYAATTSTIGKLASVATGSVLVPGGVSTAPAWSTAPTFAGTNLTGTGASFTAGNATKWTTGRTLALTGDVTYTSPSLDGSGNVTAAATLAATSNTTLTSLPNLVGVGTFTSGGTGAGFTIALTTSTVTGTLAAARGGTGVSNTGTITLAGNLATTGAFNTTFAQTGTGTVTLPSTSSTMARTDAAQTFTGTQSMTSPAVTTSLTTPSTSFDLLNTNATTLNIGGATTTLRLGAGLSTNIRCNGDYFVFRGNSLETWLTNGTDELTLNYAGYNGGSTQFRNLAIYDGKGAYAALLTGSTKSLTVYGGIVASTTIRLGNYIVSGLPSAATAGVGATAFVTDASTTIVLGLGVAVVGGGANKVPVYSDGTNWIIG